VFKRKYIVATITEEATKRARRNKITRSLAGFLFERNQEF